MNLTKFEYFNNFGEKDKKEFEKIQNKILSKKDKINSEKFVTLLYDIFDNIEPEKIVKKISYIVSWAPLFGTSRKPGTIKNLIIEDEIIQGIEIARIQLYENWNPDVVGSSSKKFNNIYLIKPKRPQLLSVVYDETSSCKQSTSYEFIDSLTEKLFTEATSYFTSWDHHKTSHGDTIHKPTTSKETGIEWKLSKGLVKAIEEI